MNIFVTSATQKSKASWKWCRCIPTCRSTYVA